MNLVRLLAISLITMVLAPLQAFAEDYVIDLVHSTIEFKVSHLGYSYVVGRFNKFDGDFSYDPENPSTATINITIDLASVDSNFAERDKHVRSDKFFDVKKHPDSTFTSTKFEENPDGTFTVIGEFSLRGITNSITIEGEHIGDGKDPWGGYRRGMEGVIIFDAEDYGLPEWVGDVEMYLVAEGIRQ